MKTQTKQLRIYAAQKKDGSRGLLLPLVGLDQENLSKTMQTQTEESNSLITSHSEKLDDGILALFNAYYISHLEKQLKNSRRGDDIIADGQIQNALEHKDIKELLTTQHSVAKITTILIDTNSEIDKKAQETYGIPLIIIKNGKAKNHYLQAAYDLDITMLKENVSGFERKEKPSLLLHICCAPDLTRPLHRLKNHFKLHLFRYNPNIHPRKEHEQRYAQFIKLIGLEKGDYEILEDRYDPKEFFNAFHPKRKQIDINLEKAEPDNVLEVAAKMKERTSRCSPCYSMRLDQAAKNAEKNNIPYFTSTLLISPKKDMQKLFNRGVEAENSYPGTHFLRFDFAKNNGHHEAGRLTKEHGLRRQNYCGCSWTIPKFQKGKHAKPKNQQIRG